MNDLSTSGVIRTHEDADGGVHVWADIEERQFLGAFRVMKVGALAVKVTLGTVEDRIPYIGSVPLHAKRWPTLKLESGPNEALLSWVALRVTIDLETGKMDPEKVDAAQVVHVNDYALLSENGLSPDDGQGNGYFPLALLVWASKAGVRKIVQNTWFNRRHSFKPGEEGRKGVHYFPPVL